MLFDGKEVCLAYDSRRADERDHRSDRLCWIGQTGHGEEPSLVSMMKLTMLTCSLAIAGAVTLGAQSSKTTTKTKVEVKDGKDVKVTGCVEMDSFGSYVLTHVTDKSGALHRYLLVSDSDDFSKVIGRRVQIEGRVADRDNGKVEIKSETKVDGPGTDTSSKAEGKGPYVAEMRKSATPELTSPA